MGGLSGCATAVLGLNSVPAFPLTVRHCRQSRALAASNDMQCKLICLRGSWLLPIPAQPSVSMQFRQNSIPATFPCPLTPHCPARCEGALNDNPPSPC